MKKILSYFLSFTLLINLSTVSFTFSTSKEPTKDQKSAVATEFKEMPTKLSNDNKNNKLSDEELKSQIVKLMKNGDIKFPHKTVLDILYKLLGIPTFLLKAILISAASLISATALTALSVYFLTLRRLNNITNGLKNTTFNINVSDGAACTIITTLLIPFYKIFQIPLPNEEKYIEFCFNKLNDQKA